MKFWGVFIGLFLGFAHVFGQAFQCPENIGFEDGTLKNWQCYIGSIDRSGIISVSPSAPVYGRQTVLKYQSNQLDPYGRFPVTCPNGSLYSLKLGNDGIGAQAEQVSYTFTVPANQKNYSIIYNYAVVFQNPDHQNFEQPKFTAKVFDVTSNKYVDCGSFEFVASSGLPGFQQSPYGNSIFYKPWAPITINLFGYEGKTLRLEFTTNDCTRGGHFGYAYIDVNENCASPITGNIYCAENSVLNLSAPAGFLGYNWYNEDFSKVLGNRNTLTVSPAPPDGTRYALQIVPYPGFGCQDTLYTTVVASKEVLNLAVRDSIFGCESGISLKPDSITKGSSPDLVFSYFSDAAAQNYVPDPSSITSSGTYYIQATNALGCIDIKPIMVKLEASPAILISNPAIVCKPDKVDLTQNTVTAGSNSSLNYSYWKDALATIPVDNPRAVDSSGTYFIKGTNSTGCSKIVPVVAEIDTQPNLVLNKIVSCGSVDLTNASITAGSNGNLTFSYWKDAAATIALPSPSAITSSGNYYVKGTNRAGCFTISPVRAEVYPAPVVRVVNPAPVRYPATVDITATFAASDSLSYSFYKDSVAVTLLDNAKAIQKSGTYYIKAVSKYGCSVILPVLVTIEPPLTVQVIAPNTFTPNNDGVNDFFKIDVEGVLQLAYFKIYNRYGQQVFETKQINNFWNGSFNGSNVPAGTYYWVLDGKDPYRNQQIVKSGSITLIR